MLLNGRYATKKPKVHRTFEQGLYAAIVDAVRKHRPVKYTRCWKCGVRRGKRQGNASWNAHLQQHGVKSGFEYWLPEVEVKEWVRT